LFIPIPLGAASTDFFLLQQLGFFVSVHLQDNFVLFILFCFSWKSKCLADSKIKLNLVRDTGSTTQESVFIRWR